MSEKILVYHGGAAEYLGQVIKGQTPLIGKRVLYDSSMSGTLTNEEEFARRWAMRKRGINPVLLKYSIPESLLIDEGLLFAKETAHGFITNLEVDYSKLPKMYLQALFGFNLLDDATVKVQVELGNLSFHKVPYKYLQGYESL